MEMENICKIVSGKFAKSYQENTQYSSIVPVPAI